MAVAPSERAAETSDFIKEEKHLIRFICALFLHVQGYPIPIYMSVYA